MKKNMMKYTVIAIIVLFVAAIAIRYMYPYSTLSINKKVEVDSDQTTSRYHNNLQKLSSHVPTLSEDEEYNEKIKAQVENVLASSALNEKDVRKADILQLLNDMNGLVKSIGHHVRYQPDYFNEEQRSYLIAFKNHLQANSYNTNQIIEDSFSSNDEIVTSIHELYKGMNQDIEALLQLS
ncbi:hypothetical protein [Exiguobacterium sp. OS-77]|uniref:hypothetical protein n=1 Tax=Exiguobacterium sp. OS-77 TaxID=1241306 RepID=UPI00041A548C|nr:hypothetical protein [Exiguobacterium sp. OS-77]